MEIKQHEIARSYKTKQYSNFKSLIGNREITPARIKKVEKSVEKIGWVPSRLVVNEKNEVIDGQCRLEVAKKNGFTVYVDVVNGLGVEDCRSMNENNSKWQIRDYIHSYAEDGIQDFVYIEQLFKEFPRLGINPVMIAVDDSYGVYASDRIRRGDCHCTQEQYENARRLLHYMVPIHKTLSRAGGRVDYYYKALKFVLGLDDVRPEELSEKILTRPDLLAPAVNVDVCIKSLDDIYNTRKRKSAHVYIAHAYEKAQVEGAKKGGER